MSNILKKGLIVSLMVVCILQSILSTFQFAYGSNYSMLGTNAALGSVILDANFVSEDWNKWEMITWGVFLSNFAVPLVDDYESAFNSNITRGSKGSGFKALAFGSGSDPANANTISGLLNYAVNQQKTSEVKPIYVAYSPITRKSIDKKPLTEADAGRIREATFKDMFIMSDKADGDSWIKLEDVTGVSNQSATIVPIDGLETTEGYANEIGKSERYVSVATINEGSIPTFYVKNGAGYEEVLDYANGWDVQLLTAWLARVACGEFKDEFKDLFNNMWSKSTDLKLALDCFGNIIVPYDGSRRVVIPASINQHLTDSPKINLISSMLFNGYTSGLSGEEINVRGQQSISGWFGLDSIPVIGTDLTDIRFGGLPALGSHLTSVPNGLILMYYDLDTISYQTYFNGGAAANGTKTVTGEAVPVNNTHYGKAVKELFDLDASKATGNKYIFKLEAANMDKFDFAMFSDGKAGEALANMLNASGQIANIAGASVNAKVLSEIITNNGKVNLFDEPVIIPVQMNNGRTGTKVNSSGAARVFMSYLYDTYKSGRPTLAGEVTGDYVNTLLNMSETATMKQFKELILGIKDNSVSKLLAGFVAEKSTLFKLNVDADKLTGAELGDKSNPFKGMASTKVDGKNVADILFDEKGSLDYFPGRLIKAYPVSEVMRAVGNVLGVREGTEFSLYSTFIYMTYLDWYGVKTNGLNGSTTSEFNPRLFDGTSDVLKVDINTISDIKTEEDKKKEVLNYTYMMLHPTEGREYRNEMMQSYINNFVYDAYQKIVYGNATSYYSNVSSNLATRNATGFLSLDSYLDNFTTAWFINIYSKVAIYIIAISLIGILVAGLFKRRKLSWFLLALAVVINTILIVPSAGEITPAVINNFVQKMFSNKMTYWGISEAVTNATIEADFTNNTSISTGTLSSLNKKEQTQVVELVKTLNVAYLDRALMLKNDISRKVTQTQSGNYAEIQKLRSARWMLPMIMRQFTANDGSADYVYVPLGDMYDDLSNMYWLYKPEDAANSGTISGQRASINSGVGDTVANTEDPIKLADRKSYYPDYVDTTIRSSGATIPYRSAAYYGGKALVDMPHTYSYLLKTNANPINRLYGFGGVYEEGKSFEAYVDKSLQSGKAQSFMSASTLLEQQGGTYNRFDRSTVMQSFGYLWATESTYHYFYQSVKDCFDSDMTLGALIGKLQGQYVKTDAGNEVRTSFMHADKTNYIKDVLDLEELFTNTVPYIYEMQITTGGFNGKSGVLGDKKIGEYDIYSNNYKSWMFRSNWVTKLMESPELTKSAIVRDVDGNKKEIVNPMLIDCYPSNRPMVFSEAQMYELGLHEADLNIVELKAIEVNKDVSQRWTMLLNYANVKGMTKEVLLRQMATEAVVTFNAEYSPTGILNGAYTMYPNGLDLRGISFDSVMKMLMLNLTKDTTYIYGDTMQNIIADSDMFSALLLLTSAFMCSYVIPLVRNVTMGLIFYLGFIAIIYALLSSNKQKAKVSCGYIISNLIFMALTLIYYAVFSGLMAVTTSDSVLTVQSVQISTGNPVWCFIVIIVVSAAYIFSMFKMIDFCFKHYRDMGFEVYAAVAGMVTDSISNGIDNLGDKISNYGAESPKSGVSIRSSRNTNRFDTSGQSAQYGDNGGSYSRSDEAEGNDRRNKDDKDYDTRTYKYGDDRMDDASDDTGIDEQIKKGKNMKL